MIILTGRDVGFRAGADRTEARLTEISSHIGGSQVSECEICITDYGRVLALVFLDWLGKKRCKMPVLL
jgi:hypothetical protein